MDFDFRALNDNRQLRALRVANNRTWNCFHLGCKVLPPGGPGTFLQVFAARLAAFVDSARQAP
jgi:hypothetical protein